MKLCITLLPETTQDLHASSQLQSLINNATLVTNLSSASLSAQCQPAAGTWMNVHPAKYAQTLGARAASVQPTPHLGEPQVPMPPPPTPYLAPVQYKDGFAIPPARPPTLANYQVGTPHHLASLPPIATPKNAVGTQAQLPAHPVSKQPLPGLPPPHKELGVPAPTLGNPTWSGKDPLYEQWLMQSFLDLDAPLFPELTAADEVSDAADQTAGEASPSAQHAIAQIQSQIDVATPRACETTNGRSEQSRGRKRKSAPTCDVAPAG